MGKEEHSPSSIENSKYFWKLSIASLVVLSIALHAHSFTFLQKNQRTERLTRPGRTVRKGEIPR